MDNKGIPPIIEARKEAERMLAWQKTWRFETNELGKVVQKHLSYREYCKSIENV
jgi:hypothetical protein